MRPYLSKLNIIINNFKVIEDLGRKFPKPESKTKAVFVVVECIDCKEKLTGQFTHFKYGARQCLKCTPKSWKLRRNYEGEIHGNFEIIKDYESRERRRSVRAKCISCDKEYDGKYFTFRNLKRACTCKDEIKRTDDWIRIRKIYLGMVYRCHNENCDKYKDYGLKGIKVCAEWLESKTKFYEWSINNGYESNLTIDRINNDFGYFPENCRWSDMTVQARNKKRIISKESAIEIKRLLNEGYTHQKIAEITSISHHVVSCISKGRTWKEI